jgi:hypothetical protein
MGNGGSSNPPPAAPDPRQPENKVVVETKLRRFVGDPNKWQDYVDSVFKTTGMTLDKFVESLSDVDVFMNTYLKVNGSMHAFLIDELEREFRASSNRNLEDSQRFVLFKEAAQNLSSRRSGWIFLPAGLKVELFLRPIAESSGGFSGLKNFFVRSFAHVTGYKFGAMHVGLLVDGTVIHWGDGPSGPSLVHPQHEVHRAITIEISKSATLYDYLKGIAGTGVKLATNAANAIHNAAHMLSLDVLAVHAVRLGKAGIDTAKAGIDTAAQALSLDVLLENLGARAASAFALLGTYLGTVQAADLRKIAEVCVEYNTTKDYDVWKCNCQDFVMAVTDKLELRLPNSEGELGRFLERLKQGKSDFTFKGSRFGTFTELLQYITKEYHCLTDDDKLLLKAFYDAFEMKFREERLGEKEAWKPSESSDRVIFDLLHCAIDEMLRLQTTMMKDDPVWREAMTELASEIRHNYTLGDWDSAM